MPRVTAPGERSLKVRRHTQSVSRALDILLCFSSEAPIWTQIELSRHLGLYKSTVHRLLLDLAARGLVWEDPETKQYRLGVRLVELGLIVREFHPLRSAALPLMRDLVESTGETVALHVREGDEVFCVERIETSARVRLGARIGDPVPLYVGSSARAILAFLPEAEIQRVVKERHQRLFRGRPVLSLRELSRALHDAQGLGYAVSAEEIGPGAAGVSAPILDAQGGVYGSLSILSPVDRMQPGSVPELGRRLMAAAARVAEVFATRELDRPPSPRRRRASPATGIS